MDGLEPRATRISTTVPPTRASTEPRVTIELDPSIVNARREKLVKITICLFIIYYSKTWITLKGIESGVRNILKYI